MEAFKSITYALRNRYLPYHEGRLIWQTERTGNNLMPIENIMHSLHPHKYF